MESTQAVSLCDSSPEMKVVDQSGDHCVRLRVRPVKPSLPEHDLPAMCWEMVVKHSHTVTRGLAKEGQSDFAALPFSSHHSIQTYPPPIL